ncbi:hypothetical protein QR680_001162 [Steinernema hermaphroditum]|uniref:Aurora kinase n=1 Tax=Steinernema hermaphroditum TaxID=289476 RepID=A0AA39GZX6_9BILA|nr:hypothetical protein QR680_001162 [Steinernema hermaphroditum]
MADNSINTSSELSSQLSLDDFEIGRILGRGRFGVVFRGRHIESRDLVAIKVIRNDQIDELDMYNQLEEEIVIQSNLKHENIVQLYAYFHDDSRHFLVMELADCGSLAELLRQSHRFDSARAAFYLRQVIDAVVYCHDQDVIHRGLKLENILLAERELIKVADFGWSVKRVPGIRRRTICGTIECLAPEMLNEEPYDFSIDVWAVGVLLYEFLVGYGPFAAELLSDTIDLIRNVQYDFPEGFPDGAKEIVSNLLVENPDNRVALSEVLTTNWMITESRAFEERLEPTDRS